MSDPVQDEQDQPGDTPELTPEAPETTVITDANGKQYLDMETATPEQLREAMQNPEKFTSEKPATPTTDEKTGGEAPDEDPDKDKDHGDEVRPANSNRMKVRTAHLSDAEREVFTLVSSKKISLPEAQEEVVAKLVRGGASLKEAEKSVYGGPARRSSSSEEAPRKEKPSSEKDDEDQVVDPVAEKQTEIDQIKSDLKKARDNYDVPAIEELRDKLADAREDLRDLKSTVRQASQSAEEEAEAAFAAQVEDSTTRAIELFPDAAKEGTELFEAIQDGVEDLKESNPDFFKNPDWPLTLSAVEAAKLGIPSSKQKGAATAQSGEQKGAVVPKKQARTLVPASGTSGGGSNRSSESSDPKAELEAAGDDPEKLLAYVRKYGRRPSGALGFADAMA